MVTTRLPLWCLVFFSIVIFGYCINHTFWLSPVPTPISLVQKANCAGAEYISITGYRAKQSPPKPTILMYLPSVNLCLCFYLNPQLNLISEFAHHYYRNL